MYRLTFQSVLGDFAAIICQENFHFSRGSSQSSFVIRKYTIFLRTDVYWFFFCVMILCCVSQMNVKLNDLAVKARESSSLFLSTYDNPMRFRNSNYNKDQTMTMKSKSDQTNQIHFLFWSVKCILVLSKSMII